AVCALPVPVRGNGHVYSLAPDFSHDGDISCPNTCVHAYLIGATITLGAEVDPGYVFTGWQGCPSPDGAYCYITMPDTPLDVSATFVIGRTLTVTRTSGGSVGGTGIKCGALCSHLYAHATTPPLPATPLPRSPFPR